ncbi:MAG: ROK family protein [Planctomycetota bacterium]|nr:ROK family protein [Planctomycetota bacterium]
MKYAIGIDLGATNIKAVSVTEGGETLERRLSPTEDDARGRWVEQIRRHIDEMQANRDEAARWIGLCAPGYAHPDGRSIAWMQGRLEALEGLDWTEALGARERVPVLNDAHGALLGEVWLGTAAGARDAILLTLGTGVGGAVLADGRLLRGHRGRAGHLGHITLDLRGPPDIVGTPGSLEDAVGNCTLDRRTGGAYSSVEKLVDAYRRGEPLATRVWLDSLDGLACGIASLVNAVDPEYVILGGGIARAGPTLFEPLQCFLERVEWRPTGEGVRVVPAALGEYGGALGAARHAMQQERERPGRPV